MTLSEMPENSSFAKFVLVLWLISSFFVFFLLARIDWIVHGDLYDFGLQFNDVWATPYWALLRAIYVCLAVPSVLSAIVLGLDFSKRFKGKKRVSVSVGNPAGVKAQSSKGNSMIVSCPSCKKTFGKPLVMLDFSSGKSSLVNTCPYCNTRLGEEYEKEDENDIEVGVLSADEKVKMKRPRKRKRS